MPKIPAKNNISVTVNYELYVQKKKIVRKINGSSSDLTVYFATSRIGNFANHMREKGCLNLR